MKVHVAHNSIGVNTDFSGTMAYWTKGFLTTGSWSHHLETDLVAPSGSTDAKVTVLVEASVRAEMALSGSALVHVLGDVDGQISVGEHSEVVIAGDVLTGGAVRATGLAAIFVGGNLQGTLDADSSCAFYVLGSVTGEIHTGRPRATIHVAGDFDGTVRSTAEGGRGMVDLRVGGHLSQQIVHEIERCHFTAFKASAGVSDRSPGVYQLGRNYWVVRRDQSEG